MKQPAEPIENYINEIPLSIRDSDLKKINLPNIQTSNQKNLKELKYTLGILSFLQPTPIQDET